jgi:hypothetical protein
MDQGFRATVPDSQLTAQSGVAWAAIAAGAEGAYYGYGTRPSSLAIGSTFCPLSFSLRCFGTNTGPEAFPGLGLIACFRPY